MIKFNIKSSLVLAILVIAVISCYHPKDVYYKDLEPNISEFETIDFISSSDTIYLQGYYNWLIDLRHIEDFLAFELYIDDELLKFSEYSRESITINSWEYSEKSYQLILQVYKKSDTGSIAAELGYEVATTIISKTIVVLNSYKPELPKFKHFGTENGELYFQLEPLFKYQESEVRIAIQDTVFELINPVPETKYFIKGYFGETLNYDLAHKDVNSTSWISGRYTYDPGFTFEKVGNELRVNWDEYPLKAISGLKIIIESVVFGRQELTREISLDARNVTFDLDFTFPYNYKVLLIAINQEGEEKEIRDINYFARSRVVNDDFRFFPFRIIDRNTLIVYDNPTGWSSSRPFNATIYEIHDKPTNEMDSLSIKKELPNVFFTEDFTTVYHLDENVLFLLNSETLDKVEQTDLTQLIDTLASVDGVYPSIGNLLIVRFNERYFAKIDWQAKSIIQVKYMDECYVTSNSNNFLTQSGRYLSRIIYRSPDTRSYELVPGDNSSISCDNRRFLVNDYSWRYDSLQNNYAITSPDDGLEVIYNIEPYSIEPYAFGDKLFVYGDDQVLRQYSMLDNELLWQKETYVSYPTLYYSIPIYEHGILGILNGSSIYLDQ